MRWLVLDYKKKKDRENNMMEDQDIERVSKGDPRVSDGKSTTGGLVTFCHRWSPTHPHDSRSINNFIH